MILLIISERNLSYLNLKEVEVTGSQMTGLSNQTAGTVGSGPSEPDGT